MAPEPSYQQKIDDLTKQVQGLNKENSKLRKTFEELCTLNEIALAISGSMDSEEIMKIILLHSIRSFEAEQGEITLLDECHPNLWETLFRSMKEPETKKNVPLHLNKSIVTWMKINKKPLLVNHPLQDPRFNSMKWKEPIHSLISAPLMVHSKLIGMINIYNKKPGKEFTDDDLRMLSIIASESAQVLENIRLKKEEKVLENVTYEITLASRIQKKLLPKRTPDIQNYSLCGRNITAYSVGGDYYDFIQLDNARWAICLGDVSGKGIPASLLMSNLHAILRGLINYLPTPSLVLKDANRHIFRCTDSENFVTLFIGILNTETHVMHYSNGGHEHPFFIRSVNNYLRLNSGGIPLGIFEEQDYEEGNIEFIPGDKLIIFSDGITDSRNQNDEAFGMNNLERLLLNDYGIPCSQLMENIFTASLSHNTLPQPFDDMTMVVLSRIK